MMSSSDNDPVRACLRWDDAGDRALRGLDASGWLAVMEVVRRRHGQALLARRLSRAPDLTVPEDVVEELQRYKLAVAARALAGLARLAPAVEASGVPVMALKGLDLASRIYGDFGSRPMGDMDILVRPEHVGKMAAALQAQGFRACSALRQSSHHQVFYSPLPGGLPVELHWALGCNAGQTDPAELLEAAWREAEQIDIAGSQFLVMNRQHLLLYLCHHLERHLFNTPLTQVWDLGEILQQAGTGFDWQRFWEHCDRYGQRKGAQAAMHLAAACLGIRVGTPPLPPEVQDLLPDIAANLGRYPQSEAREPSVDLVLLFGARTPLSIRWRILRRTLFPSRRLLAEAGGGGAGPASYAALWWKVLTNFARKRIFARIVAPPLRTRSSRAARLSEWLR
ncbi:MAG: nucleotidyltransferase family protein [Rhizobiales bacterium]|nr:nucleotidyltransferase family protein [Hyphomicrobiales bacterium]